jgi:hypothetical protein
VILDQDTADGAMRRLLSPATRTNRRLLGSGFRIFPASSGETNGKRKWLNIDQVAAWP